MLLLLGAPSCVDEEELTRQEQQALNEVRSNIRNEFETEYLTESALYAYETTAKQKLTDLVDYLQVLTDTSMDISFRQKAGQMILNMFKSENEKVHLILNISKPSIELKVHQFIKKGLENKLPFLSYSIDSLQIYEPLHRIDNNTYSGVLWFSQNFSTHTTSKQTTPPVKRFSDFYVIKDAKVFGTDSLNIWNVRLGEIR